MVRGGRIVIAVVAVLGAVAGFGGADGVGAEEAPGVEAAADEWTTVSVGAAHTCGIRVTGRLFCWGRDTEGQLGDGGANADQDHPVEVAGAATDWVAVSAGGVHTCARKADGTLWCWGADGSGQLGDGGTNSDQATPALIAGGVTDWRAFDAGESHTCARRATRQLRCWGRDNVGQLGDGGTNADQGSPVVVPGGRWAPVAGGQLHSCARKTNGRLFCWGRDFNGQLGDGGANTDQTTPVQVDGAATDWRRVATGDNHTCARRTAGRLFCWGSDADGQLGDDPANASQTTPVRVPGTRWAVVSAGGNTTCATKTNRTLFCWGSDQFGQLGDGGANAASATPVRIL